MNQSVLKRMLSRGAFIFLVILGGYFLVSTLWLTILSGHWILSLLVVVFFLALALPFLDKAFGDRLPFLSTWPTPAANSRIHHYLSVLALRDYSPRTATTHKQVAISLLIAPLSLLAIIAAMYTAALFFTLSEFGENLGKTLLWTSLGMSLFYLALHGLAFRLRVKYDVKSALLAIAIHSPMVILTVMMWMLMMPFARNGETFRVSWFTVWVTLFFGLFMTALLTLLHRVGITPAPAPAFTANPLYRRIEIAVSIPSRHRHYHALRILTSQILHIDVRPHFFLHLAEPPIPHHNRTTK